MALIDLIKRKPKRKEILVGIGDDAAVVRFGNKNLVLKTDVVVENDHFSLKWFSPKQIGMKAIEVNVSDFGAMNSKPLYCLISLNLRKNTSVEFVKQLYDGIYSACNKYEIDVVGGNMSHGKEIFLSIAMIGESVNENFCLRKSAKIGDLIVSSGTLGESSCGFNLIKKKISGFERIKKKHLEPKAQLKKALSIAQFANAMEDVSDGLAAEVKNICKASKKGAIIFWNKIPVSKKCVKASKKLGKLAQNFALFGGEDYELIATISSQNLKKLQKLKEFENIAIVGKIVAGKKVFLEKSGKKIELKKSGFDHFS